MNKTLPNLDVNTIEYEPLETKKWGFTTFSEKINGRVAMIAFIFLFLLEAVTKQKIIDFIK